MPEMGTSGLMSGDGKRGGARRQYPRPSSTLPVLGNANAALGLRQMALVLRDYENGNVFRPVSGWTTLPDTILQALAIATNCHVQTDHRLLSAKQNNGGIDLVFATAAGEVEGNAG